MNCNYVYLIQYFIFIRWHFLKTGEMWLIVQDGQEGKHYEKILLRTLTFNPEGTILAYGVKYGRGDTVVLNDTEGRGFEGVLNKFGAKIIFNIDSLRYLAFQNNSILLVEELVTK